jgi:hypothetical protein
MSMTREAIKPPQALPTVHELTLSRDPQKALLEASKAAKALQEVVKKARLIQRIGDRDHLRVEAWQTLGAFYGVTADIEWTKPITQPSPTYTGPATYGFEARAVALWHGQHISAAEAECRTEESNWKGKPLFQLKAMAQTRATARALRHVLAWVVVLAGYEATPAEEMTSPLNAPPTPPPTPLMPPVMGQGYPGGPVVDERTIKGKCADFMAHLGLKPPTVDLLWKRLGVDSGGLGASEDDWQRMAVTLELMSTGTEMTRATVKAFERFPKKEPVKP